MKHDAMNMITRSLLAIGCLLFVSACGGLNVKQDAAGNLVLNVSLNEDQVSGAIQNALVNVNVNGVTLLTQLTGLDLQPGKIVVKGNHTAQDGQVYAGSFEIAVAAVGGRIQAQLQNVNIVGTTISNDLINQVNAQIAAGLSAVSTNQPNVTFNSVTITDSTLTVEITVKTR